MSAIDVHVFRDSVAKIVRALTDSNIKVRQQGSKAYVESDPQGRPVSVTLPSIPDNAPADLLNAIQGFLDHEVSHVLHTDFPHSTKMLRECEKSNDKISPSLWNVVEDVFVEREMAKRFAGSMVNIDNIQRYATKKMLAEGFANLKDEGASDTKLRSYLMPAAVRASAGQPAFVEFMKDKWSVMGEMEEGIKALGPKLKKINSTKDAWSVTQELRTVVAQPNPPGNPDGDGDGDGDGDSSGDKSKDSKNKPKPKPKSDKKPPGDKKDKPEKPEKSDDKSDKGDDDGEGDGEGEDESDSDGDGGKGGDEKDGEPGDPSDDQQDDPAEASGDASPHDQGGHDPADYSESDYDEKSIEELIDPSMIKSMDEMGAELIEKEIKEHLALNPGEYVPFSRDLDYVGPLPAVDQFETWSLDKSEVAKTAAETSHVIQGEVERLFRARSASRWNPGQRKGKISRNAMHRACIGDERVFRQKIEAQSRDVAVELVIDCSGSMSGAKIKYAATAAYMLTSVLERINVPCEVVGFTTMMGPIATHLKKDWEQFQSKINDLRYYNSGSDPTNYARYSPICLYVLKDFSRRFDDKAKKTLGFLNCASGFMSGNVDGESIEIAALRLQQRKEARKVMIVLSDGQPAADGPGHLGQQKLKQVITDISASNMEVYGLGLMDNAVRGYYPKCEVISKAEEIPTKVLSLIQQLLVK